MNDNLNLYAAHALSKDQFCIALHERSYDDEYSIILIYDHNYPDRPWRYTKQARTVDAICAHRLEGQQDGYALLSTEGDVFLLHGPDGYHEKVLGAGLHTSDAKGLGACNDICQIGDTLFVVGMGSQIYKRIAKGDWEAITSPDLKVPEGYDPIFFRSIAGVSENNYYICGIALSSSVETPIATKAAMQAAEDKEDWDEYFRLMDVADRERKQKRKPKFGCCYHWNGNSFTDCDMDVHFPHGIFVESSEQVWIGGSKGHVLGGSAEEGFEEFELTDVQDAIYSVTKFKDKIICAGDHGLYEYKPDASALQGEGKQLKPRVSKRHADGLSPLKVQAVDHVMFYFDRDFGIYIWNGDKKWTNIPIPPELLKRDFKEFK